MLTALGRHGLIGVTAVGDSREEARTCSSERGTPSIAKLAWRRGRRSCRPATDHRAPVSDTDRVKGLPDCALIRGDSEEAGTRYRQSRGRPSARRRLGRAWRVFLDWVLERAARAVTSRLRASLGDEYDAVSTEGRALASTTPSSSLRD